MRLLSSIFGFALRKAGLFVALLLSLFLVLLLMSALVPALREAEAGRDRLVQVVEERRSLERELTIQRTEVGAARSATVQRVRASAEQTFETTRREVVDRTSEVSDKQGQRDDACGFFASLPERLPVGPNPCATAQAILDEADAALKTAEATRDEAQARLGTLRDDKLTSAEKLDRLGEQSDRPDLERRLDSTESDLARTRAEERSLRADENSWSGRVVSLWAGSWKWLAMAAALAILLPGLLRLLSYFVLMPLVARAGAPIELADESDHGSARISTSPAVRTLSARLGAGEALSVRSEHVRSVPGRVGSRLLYSRRSPFISFAAGLYGLSHVTGVQDGTPVTLAAPNDPDSYLMRIDFERHPGLVMYPKHVVGVIGSPRLTKRWRWGIQALATGQVRYVMFAGTGSLIVQGSGDVVSVVPDGGPTRMDQHLVMGFDSRTSIRVRRTESRWGYLWGKTDLVVDEFTGPHPFFWQKSSAERPSNPVARTFNTFFSAIGKLLGF